MKRYRNILTVIAIALFTVLCLSSCFCCYDDYYEPDYYEEEQTYERYNGSYAQDVEGWSDQDIDDVFDGDPDAYWNID